ncbi:protein phosphatase 2C domain-containing protein [Streptomyces sp. NPDC020412]|uniref:protein phosphatase 2C domain-containing protein n=1 Tax=Streptomyces sp. NPDC020412 TaxID=3365073 RepID=UPI0037A1127C
MSQQGEQPADAADDWWNRLYDESALDTGRPAARADDVVDTLDDRFASATDAVSEPAPNADPPAASPASPAPFTPSASPAPPAPSPPAPQAEELDEPSAAPAAPGPVRPRAWWEADPADTLDDPDFTPASPPQPPPASPPRPPSEEPSRSEASTPTGTPARTVTADLAAAPTKTPPRPPDPRRPAAGSPWDPPQFAPTSPPAVPRARTNLACPEGIRNPDRPPPPTATRPHPGYVGDGPPTYEAEPTALPAADPDALEGLVADTVLDGAHYGGLTLRAASLRGDSARYRGEPRRDALLTARFGTGNGALVLVVVATGARAADGAHQAAADACRWIAAAVGRSHARLAEDIRAGRRGDLKSGLHRLTDRSLGKLRATAADLGVHPDEYTAALRCLLLPADPQCRTRVFFGVGPGGLFRLREGEWQDIEPHPAEAAEAAETAGTTKAAETTKAAGTAETATPGTPGVDRTPRNEGTPAADGEPFRFRASVARPGDTLLMCSSGLADPLRGEPALAAELSARWRPDAPPGLAAFLTDVQLRVKGYADDRTAVGVWESGDDIPVQRSAARRTE